MRTPKPEQGRIQEAREKLASDVDELKAKLKPKRVAKATARRAAENTQRAARVAAAQSERAAKEVARTARANPLPFAAAGAALIGAAWFMARRRRSAEARIYADYP